MSTFKLVLPDKTVDSDNPLDLVVSSAHPSPKIDTRANPPHIGIIDLNWQTTGLSFANDTIKELYQFEHNLGYVPAVFATYEFDNGTVRRGGTLPLQFGALGMFVLESDRTHVKFRYYSFDLGGTPINPFTMQTRYYVLAQNGKE